MKKATKATALVLATAMLTGMLAACSSTDNAGNNASAPASSEATEQTSSEASTESTPAEGGNLVFGTNAEFPPFEFVTAQGVIDQYDGIDMALAKQIAEENGMTAVIENMEFDSLLVALQNGQIDAAIAGMTVTEERKETVDFSVPYYTATQVMIVKEDSDIATAADMADKKICVVQGYTGEVCVKKLGDATADVADDYKYEAFKKGTEAVMELVNGKCDVVVLDSATAAKYVSDNEGLKIVEDPSAFESEEYAIAVQKGNTELLEWINDAMVKLGSEKFFHADYDATLKEVYGDAVDPDNLVVEGGVIE